jgi:hypothetical protein
LPLNVLSFRQIITASNIPIPHTKGSKMKTLVLFLSLPSVGMFAADRRNIAEFGTKADPATAKAAHPQDTGFAGPFPQANGFMYVSPTGDVAFNTLPGAVADGACIFGQVIAPNGDVTNSEEYCNQDTSGQSYSFYLELSTGTFPSGSQVGTTRFRGIIQGADGKITETNAYVFVHGCCAPEVPAIASIVPSPDGSTTTVSGQFSAPIIAVNGTVAQILSSSVVMPTPGSGGVPQGTFVVQNPYFQQNSVITICDQSYCSQGYFHIPLPVQNGKG